MSKSVKMRRLPKCDFCKDDTLARYDARTYIGSWANMCEPHWMQMRMHSELGTGKGQELILDKKAK